MKPPLLPQRPATPLTLKLNEWKDIKKVTGKKHGRFVNGIEDRKLILTDYSPRRSLNLWICSPGISDSAFAACPGRNLGNIGGQVERRPVPPAKAGS